MAALTEILVYNVYTLEICGIINVYKSLTWPEVYNGYGSFQLWAPVTTENASLLKEGNFLYINDGTACIIKYVQADTDDDGQLQYSIKGYTLEWLLTTRVIHDTYTNSSVYPSDVIYDIINQNCISPTDKNRVIPHLTAVQKVNYGEKTSFQKTGGEVYKAVKDICESNNLGFKITFDPRNPAFTFQIVKGTDRTVEQQVVDSVILSSDFEDIIDSSYYRNSSEFKNFSYISGAGENEARVKTTFGEDKSGFDRYEMYVDARDLQKTSQDASGTEVTLTDEQYIETLKQRGSEKLSENCVAENFDATVRTFGIVQYIFGEDYFLGDIITMQDRRLKLQINARITSITKQYKGNVYSVDLVFGYEYPTINQKLINIK